MEIIIVFRVLIIIIYKEPHAKKIAQMDTIINKILLVASVILLAKLVVI